MQDGHKKNAQARTGLLALDLDGTVLLPAEELVPGIVDEVRRWQDLGWLVAVITARHHVIPAIQELGADAFTRNYGAQVMVGHTEIYRRALPAGAVTQALESVPEGARVMVLTPGMAFVKSPSRPTDRPLAEWQDGRDFVKLLLEHPDVNAVQETARHWETLPDVTLIWERANACMLVAAGADKGSALQVLAQHYGLPLSHTIAAGDGFSDAAMMRQAAQFLVVGRNPVLNRGHAFAETTADVPAELASLRRAWHGELGYGL